MLIIRVGTVITWYLLISYPRNWLFRVQFGPCIFPPNYNPIRYLLRILENSVRCVPCLNSQGGQSVYISAKL